MSAWRLPHTVVIAVLFWASAVAAKSPATPDPLAGTVREPGFVDVYRDASHGRVIIGVHELDTPFLLTTSLPGGLGSNDIGLDRGQLGKQYIARFRRVGERLLLIADNTRFVADSGDADERGSAVDAFATAVLWAGPVIPRPLGDDRTVLVDIAPYLNGDRHGVGNALAGADGKGNFRLDGERSVALPESARSFPDNSEFEALLTFSGDGTNEQVNAVAVDPGAVSIRQHVSFVRLPPPGFEPRPFHPASGAFSSSRIDFAQPLDAALDVRWQPRFRLQKDASGKVLKPIVFHLDRGTPEPIRQALLDGAGWWSQAFEKAGFPGGFRVELLPVDADPMDIRYNIITWTHRDRRGWSYGNALVDPRTGEIIKGAVNLGSQRVRQDMLIAESLLAPYDKPNASELAQEAQQMALARLRQLAAHELGHTLGFAHNFAASRTATGSVMDYPFPVIDFDAQGAPRLTQPYADGLGDWDVFLVRHGYGQFADETTALASLRQQIRDVGYTYVSDPDARSLGNANPDGILWDVTGPDPLAGFDTLMKARRYALDHFSQGVLPPSRQSGELEARLVPIYLLHRYQSDALARLLGGSQYRYGLVAEGATGTRPVAGDSQRAARQRLLDSLRPEALTLPASVIDLMTPPSMDYQRDREYFATRANPVFDPLGAADAAAAMSLQLLLAPPRLHRLLLQSAQDTRLPGVRDTLDALLAATWRAPAAGSGPARLVQRSVNAVVLDALLASLGSGQLHPAVESEIRSALLALQHWAEQRSDADARQAADRIRRYLDDPASVILRPLPAVPPGSPI